MWLKVIRPSIARTGTSPAQSDLKWVKLERDDANMLSQNYSEQEIVRRVAVGPVFVGTLEACCPYTDCTTCTKTRFAT